MASGAGIPPVRPATAGHTVSAATAGDWPGIIQLFQDAFHRPLIPEAAEADRHLFVPERSLVIRQGGTVAAHTGSFRRELAVPGGVLPCAHVAWTATGLAHRRRGMLTTLMHHQLALAAASGEPLAALWSSQAPLYARFGYGMASMRAAFTLDVRALRLRAPAVGERQPPEVTCGEPAEFLPQMQAVHEQTWRRSPGWSSRDGTWWRHRVLADPMARRDGATPWRVTVTDAGGPSGYAVWRARQNWRDGSAAATIEVRELVAATAPARRSLWGFLLALDLTQHLHHPCGAADDALIRLVDDPRRLGVRLMDGLWVRIVDLPRALAGRSYAAPLDVVIEVTDPILHANTGRWRLSADRNGAECDRTNAAADLACGIDDLGAAVLGEAALKPLAEAGRVTEHRQDAVRAAHVAFTWPTRPSAPDMF